MWFGAKKTLFFFFFFFFFFFGKGCVGYRYRWAIVEL